MHKFTRRVRLVAFTLLTALIAACASGDVSTRNVTPHSPGPPPVSASLNVQDLVVSVPRTLSVSEANLYYPVADIVWRGDPRGDRRAQVKQIVRDGLSAGIRQMKPGTIPVVVDVEVTRFHSVSEKARYSVGGVHAVHFRYVLRNPDTGEAYAAPKYVRADLNAYGGQRAINAERRGITMKLRIMSHLAKVIQHELSDPEGYHAASMGLAPRQARF
ncbi:hypothetical protein SAMN05443999_101556 [Roseovarius azorensis]|uniref:Lipoprotein n=1 Tax=Roseovarius azorensis TaxID=1287727 RepID=A0A1H7HR18_9RHOB|nr:DUF6778 family protein [Roseovarius azorensis]SEK50655.1 hypothetical protein SAMN05443999_101556 [Roseovarius azorensis]